MKMWISAAFAAALLAGCSFAPDYQRPVQDIPDTWAVQPVRSSGPPETEFAARGAGGKGGGAETALARDWWRRFGDDTLDRLVMRALARNRDIEQSLARVDSARAALTAARGGLFPTLSMKGTGTRNRASIDTSDSFGAAEQIGLLEERVSRIDGLPADRLSSPSRTGTLWSGAVQAAWELDIWGRWRNASAAARESLLSAEDSLRALELSVAGQVCSAYFELLNSDSQLELTERTLAARQEYAALYEKQFAAGAISELDILNVRTQIDSLNDSLEQVRTRREKAESALLLLTGASPREIWAGQADRGSSLEALPAVPQIPAGLPSELLARRPDIASAEAALRAAHFRVGAARAAFFPSISLTGGLGTESRELDGLFSSASDTWTFGGAVDWPLLTFGRTLGQVRQSEAAVREAAAAYEQRVQQAFRDVRDALALQRGMAGSVESLAQAAARMERAAQLARVRYNEGYSPYLDVLEAERTLYSTQMDLADRRAARLSAIVQVCMALGGGW